MKLVGILPFTRSIIKQVIKPGELVIDGTMGNGIDTLFLAQQVGEQGKVLAYDVQPEALERTRTRLVQEGVEQRVQLLLKGHETAEEELKPLNQPVAAAMFNLGYRPGSDKKIVTIPDTTLHALHTLKGYLRKDGIITVVVYSGHEQGKLERDVLLTELSTWDQQVYQVLQYRFINQQNDAPFLIAIQKK